MKELAGSFVWLGDLQIFSIAAQHLSYYFSQSHIAHPIVPSGILDLFVCKNQSIEKQDSFRSTTSSFEA
jgi:hypothetical protein